LLTPHFFIEIGKQQRPDLNLRFLLPRLLRELQVFALKQHLPFPPATGAMAAAPPRMLTAGLPPHFLRVPPLFFPERFLLFPPPIQLVIIYIVMKKILLKLDDLGQF
jgi:hypothetical protein